MKNTALGIIDAQRGFMPAEEGQRLGLSGFGELPVTDGEQIISNVNRLLAAYAIRGYATFTTQDWHPENTAHFSDQPNFRTTWPVHCVGGTPGAELHPEINVPNSTYRFRKGMETLERGEDDQSYSGYYSTSGNGEHLGDVLRRRGITQVILGGLALDYCVGKTALDLRTKLGFDVTVAIDASRGIAEQSVNEMLEQFADNGIKVATTDEILAQLAIA